MDLEIAEKIRKNVIGDPVWNTEKSVFEYSQHTREVVVILKLLRAVHGIKAQNLLCQEGLFFDMMSIFRCVADCSEEICFLLEEYPKESQHVKQFIKGFFEHTIDNFDATETSAVLKKKIRSANVRFLAKNPLDDELSKMLKKTYEAFSGYVHANYSHIMQSYGGIPPNQSFNLLGIKSISEKKRNIPLVVESYRSVLLSMYLVCLKFQQTDIGVETKNLIDNL